MGCCREQNSGQMSGNIHVLGKPSISVRCCVGLLRGYKRYLSPLFPPSCRFTPTCSEYAIDAVQQCGLVRGIFLAVYRLLRCHPFAKGGYDPVNQNRYS